MRLPFFAVLLAFGMWWTSPVASRAQEAQTESGEITATQQETTENLRQEEEPQVREVEEADEARHSSPDSQAMEAKDHEAMKANDQARTGREARGLALRAESIKGMEVRNLQGESLGEIEDLLLDAESGKIRYAAISVGGFLGIGDKLIAVPWTRFELRQTGEEADAEYVLFVNITRDQLTTARGFDENQWPAFAGDEFGDEETPRTAAESGETIRE